MNVLTRPSRPGSEPAGRAGIILLLWTLTACSRLSSSQLPHPGSERALRIVAGGSFTCLLLESGRVACWGDNQFGQLGVGDSAEHDGLRYVAGLSDAKTLHTGDIESCAVGRDGTLWCWGGSQRLSPARIPVGERALDVRVSPNGRCVLFESGRLACRDDPPTMSPIRDGTALEVGYDVACVANARGDLWCRKIRDPQTACSVTPSPLREVGVGSEYVVLRADPLRSPGQPPTCLDELRAAVCARGTDGQVACTRSLEGARPNRALALVGRGSRVCMLDSGEKLSCPAYVYGCTETDCADPGQGPPQGAVLGTGALAIGGRHACVLVSNRTRVRCAGANELGQLGYHVRPHEQEPQEVAGIDDATALAVGTDDACVVRRGGTVACWGSNMLGKLGDGSTHEALRPVAVRGIVRAVAVALGPYACALLATGRVACWGWRETWIEDADIELEPGPAAVVPGVEQAVELSMNDQQACVRQTDGSVWCWAAIVSRAGEAFSPRPGRVSGIGRAAALFSAGGGVTCERESGSSELRCWGAVPRRVTDCFRLPSQIDGDYPPPEVCVPAIRLGDPSSFRAAAGRFSLPFERATELLQAQGTWCARNEQGRVQCWACAGLGGEGQPAKPVMARLRGMDDVVGLAEGDEGICALTGGRKVSCVRVEAPSRYSDDECRQLVGPAVSVASLDDAVQLEGAGGRVCARRASGHVVCWGRREHAPLGDGRSLFHAEPVELDVAPVR
ncbi:MAG: hypothetical protein JW940_20635 [Polyangiaceae bacterium]|nr:hypothetical protein [Polyangiaceae bacterium]